MMIITRINAPTVTPITIGRIDEEEELLEGARRAL